MAFRTGRPCLWSLILLLCSIYVTCIRINYNFADDSPKTYWVDQTCLNKGFTPATAAESLHMATRGARRLLNQLDGYQGWVFELLFKTERDFSVSDDAETEAWNVVEVEGNIGAMTYEVARDNADVRVYCDDDNRWTLVPDDLVSTRRGVPPNSLRTFGDDAEYEDKINFMRRDAWNEGCKGSRVLGVTYNTQYTRNNPGLPANYHSPRQTITICDLAFRSPIMKLSAVPDLPNPAWRNMKMSALNIIPTNVLLHQLLALNPYQIIRDVGFDFSAEDTWQRMIRMTETELSLSPAPYTWNAILAYAADKNWGVQRGLTTPQYSAGQNLFRYYTALSNLQFRWTAPSLPSWMYLPPGLTVSGTE